VVESKLIILSSKRDTSTDEVMFHLNGINVVRINSEDKWKLELYETERLVIASEHNRLEVFKSDYIWMRYGFHDFLPEIPSIPGLENHFFQVKAKLNKAILNFFSNREHVLGSLNEEYEHNKIIDLELAELVGLKIPGFSIMSSLNKNAINNKKLINKSINNSYFGKLNGFLVSLGLPKLISFEEENISFFPSLLQEFIPTKYEVRSFILGDEIYSMAIIKQESAPEEVLKRHRNSARYLPYSLPTRIKNKVLEFMKLKKLNTGSIDLLVDNQGEYFFLEVNPVGQFGWVSYHCNYQIEKKIANYLSHGSSKKEKPSL